MKRLFVAFKIEPSDLLQETYERFRKWFGREHITWSDSKNFHLTIKFIGDTSEEQIPAIRAALKKVAAHYSSFSLQIKGTGIFGSSYKPKIIWFGVEDLTGTLTPLTRDVVGVLEELGFPDDRQNFVPHLTMGRIKFLRFKKKLEEKIEKFKDLDFQSVHIKEFHLYESELSPDGPVYHIIETYQLKNSGTTKSKSPATSWWKRLFQGKQT